MKKTEITRGVIKRAKQYANSWFENLREERANYKASDETLISSKINEYLVLKILQAQNFDARLIHGESKFKYTDLIVSHLKSQIPIDVKTAAKMMNPEIDLPKYVSFAAFGNSSPNKNEIIGKHGNTRIIATCRLDDRDFWLGYIHSDALMELLREGRYQSISGRATIFADAKFLCPDFTSAVFQGYEFETIRRQFGSKKEN